MGQWPAAPTTPPLQKCCLAPSLPLLQIKPAVLRNYDRYEKILLKPWYSNPEQQWTAGGAS